MHRPVLLFGTTPMMGAGPPKTKTNELGVRLETKKGIVNTSAGKAAESYHKMQLVVFILVHGASRVNVLQWNVMLELKQRAEQRKGRAKKNREQCHEQ